MQAPENITIETPADIVFRLFGGEKKVAEILDVDLSTVYRWRYKGKRGTDGNVPAKYHQQLFDYARENQISLEPHHLVKKPFTNESGAPTQAPPVPDHRQRIPTSQGAP